MSIIVVVGTHWGDEAKGKIVDYLAKDSDLTIRFSGGSNAGHTVKTDDGEFKFHTLPVGVIHSKLDNIISSGVFIDPEGLIKEIESLRKKGLWNKKLSIDPNCHIITPFHKCLDQLEENNRGNEKIGTTGKGIGPACADKIRRFGIRVSDLLDRTKLDEKLNFQLVDKPNLKGKKSLDINIIVKSLYNAGIYLKPYIRKTENFVSSFIEKKKNIILEGAQGSLLDLEYGEYPFVTSSHCVAGAACLGTGIGPTQIDNVMGVVKSYCSRVGAGIMPTEIHGDELCYIRENGREYGTTTGRARRLGWLDIVLLRRAIQVNGIDQLSVTLLDVLSGMPEIKLCTAYQVGLNRVDYYSENNFKNVVPIYKTFKGWQEDISKIRKFDDLPNEAKKYLDAISNLTNRPIKLVSVGPHREQTIC